MKTIYRLACCVLATATLTFTAVGCGEDDEPTSGKNNTGEQLNPEGDPEGTVTVNIGNDGKEIGIGNIDISMTDDNNFYSWPSELLSVGKVQGLSSVRNVVAAGWSNDVLVQPGYGYVLRSMSSNKYIYARLYVEDYVTTTSGGIMGAKVKYQYPFYPDNALCFEQLGNVYLTRYNNYTYTVKISHYAPFDVEVEAHGDALDTDLDLDVQYTKEEMTFSTRNTAYTNAYWYVTITDNAGIEQTIWVYVD